MKILSYILALFLCFSPVTAQEFRIDFSNEGMKLLKKKGFGKKTIYTNGKDEKGYYLKAVADSSATGLGLEIENKRRDSNGLKQFVSYEELEDFNKNNDDEISSNRIDLQNDFQLIESARIVNDFINLQEKKIITMVN